MSQSRKIVRRMAEIERVGQNQHRNTVKEFRKRQRKVESRNRRVKAFVQGLLHVLGHETFEPGPPVIAFDRYHARIGAVGTTISAPNLRERDEYLAAKRAAEAKLREADALTLAAVQVSR